MFGQWEQSIDEYAAAGARAGQEAHIATDRMAKYLPWFAVLAVVMLAIAAILAVVADAML